MKKFIKVAFVAAIAAVAGYGVYTSQKAETMSELALANVEALADGESSGSNICYSTYDPATWLHADSVFVFCRDCTERKGHDLRNRSGC